MSTINYGLLLFAPNYTKESGLCLPTKAVNPWVLLEERVVRWFCFISIVRSFPNFANRLLCTTVTERASIEVNIMVSQAGVQSHMLF